MYQTRILTNYEKYADGGKYETFTNECFLTAEELKIQGKTDGILIYEPPLEVSTNKRFLLRTWIDLPAAEGWIAYRNDQCTKHGIDIPESSIIELV